MMLRDYCNEQGFSFEFTKRFLIYREVKLFFDSTGLDTCKFMSNSTLKRFYGDYYNTLCIIVLIFISCLN